MLNAIVAVSFIIIFLVLWAGVHLLAQKKLGNRKLGCSGPEFDDEGNQVCCHTGEACENTCETEK